MKSFETWKTWLVIIGLLLFSGVASVLWLGAGDVDLGGSGLNLGEAPAVDLSGVVEQDVEPVTIQLDEYLLGEVLVEAPLLKELNGVEVHPMVLTGVLTAIFLGGLLAVGVPLGLIYIRLDEQAEAVKEDPEFQAAQQNLEEREKEWRKEQEAERPSASASDEASSDGRSFSFVFTTSATAFLFAIFTSFALAETFYPAGELRLAGGALIDPVVPIAAVMVLITALILLAIFRPPRPAAPAEGSSDDQPIPWGTIWVILTGLVFVGIGTGLMLAVRAMGSG
ncbi:MAG: hypothetical protein R3248_12755 [Candidatus Promineifilaceae bacterium]|nr:hypothetical protein [Candidatus Promineifilaceae bacterium]